MDPTITEPYPELERKCKPAQNGKDKSRGNVNIHVKGT
jgi:hypothetical protein